MSRLPTVRAATPDRVPPLASVLAASFVEDPMIRWPFHDHDVVERAEPMFSALLGEYAKIGMVWEADDAAGVAVWISPDGGFGLEEVNDVTGPAIEELTDDGGDRYHRFWGWLESFVPGEPNWMLDMVGVGPASQGHGIGGALVRHGVLRTLRPPRHARGGCPRGRPARLVHAARRVSPKTARLADAGGS